MCGTLLGCAGSIVGGMCCGACAQCKAVKTGPISRLPYLFLLILSGIFATLMSLYGEREWDLKVTTIDSGCDGCTGNGSVFRVSLVLFVFECIHVLLIAGGAVSFHYMWFGLKFLVFVAGVVFTFFVGDNESYEHYAEFARYVPSPLYLLLQVLILITWAYDLNDTIQAKGNGEIENDRSPDADEDDRTGGNPKWFWCLLVATIALYAASFTFLGLFYVWYGPNTGSDECPTHETLISITIVLVIMNAVLSMVLGTGTLFVSAIVSLYSTFLCFAAMQADNTDTCNSFANKRNTTSLWIGVGFTLLSLCYAALKANLLHTLVASPVEEEEEETPTTPLLVDEAANGQHTGGDGATEMATGTSENQQVVSNYDDPDLDSNLDAKDAAKRDADDDGAPAMTLTQKKENIYFHVIMALAAGYMAMLLTNWATSKGDNTDVTTTGRASVWANMSVLWATEFFFFWTLLAPKICPSRFNNEGEE